MCLAAGKSINCAMWGWWVAPALISIVQNRPACRLLRPEPGRITVLSSKEPVFNVPAAVVAVLALMVAVHFGRQLLDPETGNWLIAAFAFIPWRYAGGAEQLPGGSIATVTSFVTHMFLHGDATHLLLNSAWMLVFGGAVAKRIGGPLFLAFIALTGSAGALVFLLFNFGLLAPVIGASGAVSGLMGATMRFLFSAFDDGGVAQLRDRPHTVRFDEPARDVDGPQGSVRNCDMAFTQWARRIWDQHRRRGRRYCLGSAYWWICCRTPHIWLVRCCKCEGAKYATKL